MIYMKKKCFIFVLASLLLLPACEKTDLSPVESRIDALEKDVKNIKEQLATLDKLNSEIAALQALKSCTYVSGTSYNAQTGIWTISLSDGTVIDVNAATSDGNAPAISIDSEGYWTLNGSRILVEGKPVSALGSQGETGPEGPAGPKGDTPVLGVDAEGYWTVTVGGSTTRVLDASGKPVKAVIEAGDSYFSDVKLAGDKITFTMKNGETITLTVTAEPVAFKFEIQGVEGVESFEEEETKVYTLVTENVADAMISAPLGWVVSIADTKLTVTAPLLTKSLSVSTEDSQIVFYVVCTDGRSAIVRMSVQVGPAPYDKKSLYSTYEYGLPVVIGGVEYTKAEYGAAKLLSAEDPEINSGSKVFFVPEGVTGLLKGSASDYLVVASDRKGARGRVDIASNVGAASMVFGGIDLRWADDFSSDMAWNAGEINLLEFDDCAITMKRYLLNRSSQGLRNFVVRDCDITVLASNSAAYGIHRAMICCAGDLTYSGEKIVFTNNVMTSDSDDAAVEWSIISNNGNTHTTYDSVDLSGNTFYNVNAQTTLNYILTIGSAKSITMKKNLLWKNKAAGKAFNWIKISGVTAAEATAARDAGTMAIDVTDNKLTGWPLYASDAAVVAAGNGAGQGGYYPDDSAWPFKSTTPLASGDFQVIDALAGYGAVR